MFLSKVWNGKNPLGLFIASSEILVSIFNRLLDKISTGLWRYNFKVVGSNVIVEKGVIIRFPGNIEIGNNVFIGRNVTLFSELNDSTLIIGDNTQISSGSKIDFTGDLTIGKNVLISQDVKIYTHSHRYNPHSMPIKKPLVIENNVWIGENALILENTNIIHANSLIAAGAVVTKNVDYGLIVGGNPAKFIKNKEI